MISDAYPLVFVVP